MNLSISNIAWGEEDDTNMYRFLKDNGFNGLEIAPTRIFPDKPYEHNNEAKEWAHRLKENYGLVISSMQSIWYGRDEKIFSDRRSRNELIEYTTKAVTFAEAIECKNLVFGNPRNRDTLNVAQDYPTAIEFFHTIGEIASEHHTAIAIEANPVIYNTHFINYTEQAVELAYKSNSKGIRVNADLGTIIYNNEDMEYLKTVTEYINHIHISEPGLKLIEDRKQLHSTLIAIAKEYMPNIFVSIEMGKQKISDVKSTIEYINDLVRNA